ncbi:MAG: hypothetical protein IJI14_07565 [Anaerolineaceae bacterium]|nr:hypothetical protein [Anaerolineaceae bacterium]
MLDETRFIELRYVLERNDMSVVSRSNYFACAKIFSKADSLSRYLIGKHDENIESHVFQAYLSAAGNDAVIISDTHPITSFIIIFPPGPFSFSRIRFLFSCGMKTLLQYGISYFRNIFKFISLSQKLRKKYTGDHSWYLAKFVSGDPKKGDKLLSVLLEWLDSNGEVVFSDGLSENDTYFAGKYGFDAIAVEKINKNIDYYALFRKNQKLEEGNKYYR